MIRARCVRFNVDRGYGFLERLDGGGDLFCHVTRVPGEGPLEVGELVDVEVEDSPRGPRVAFLERVRA